MKKTEFNFEDITFGKRIKNLSLESYIKSISDYNIKIKGIVESDIQLPLFLDTNVLTRYYKTSLKFRDNLFNYLNENFKQIVLTSTVQKEFVRNREDIIEAFISQSLSKFKKDYETQFIKGFKSYHESIKTHLDDFPEIGSSIEGIQKEVEKIYKELDVKINDIESRLKDLKQNDKYLNFFLGVKLLKELKDEETNLLKKQYDFLVKQLEAEKNEQENENKNATIFPGYHDKKRKGKNPYGDYIIFHEALNYMVENNTSAILLTYDAKGDWIKRSGDAHSHYIQIVYEATGQHLFILDAERYFQQKLNRSFVPLVKENSISDNLDTINIRIHILKGHFVELKGKLRELFELTGTEYFGDIYKNLELLTEMGYLSEDFAVSYHNVDDCVNKYIGKNITQNKIAKDEILFDAYFQRLKEMSYTVDSLIGEFRKGEAMFING